MDYENCIITKALRMYFDVKICEDADYVFFSVYDYKHLDVSPNCIKIYFTGELVSPDFNFCDYALGFDWLDFGDRYMRLSNCYISEPQQIRTRMVDIKHNIPSGYKIEDEKPEFCSFVVSNGNGSPLRLQMYEKLSAYKKVNSGGRFMNNIGSPVVDKMKFTQKHKFSIAFENTSYPGYSTEKLTEAFAAKTIPIYWGDTRISEVFNTKAFINVHDYASLDDVVEKVVELDNNDDAYLAMLREPAWIDEEYSVDNYTKKLALFLKHIVDMPIEQAYRYDRVWYGNIWKQTMKRMRDSTTLSMRSFLKQWIEYKYHIHL